MKDRGAERAKEVLVRKAREHKDELCVPPLRPKVCVPLLNILGETDGLPQNLGSTLLPGRQAAPPRIAPGQSFGRAAPKFFS